MTLHQEMSISHFSTARDVVQRISCTVGICQNLWGRNVESFDPAPASILEPLPLTSNQWYVAAFSVCCFESVMKENLWGAKKKQKTRSLFKATKCSNLILKKICFEIIFMVHWLVVGTCESLSFPERLFLYYTTWSSRTGGLTAPGTSSEISVRVSWLSPKRPRKEVDKGS